MKTKPSFLKWALRVIFLAVCVITAIRLAIVIENYRAKRAWEACRHRFEQKGEILDWSALVANPVPDDQNFLGTPSLAASFGFGTNADGTRRQFCDTNAHQRLIGRFEPLHKLPSQGNWRSGTLLPLGRWVESANTSLPQLRTLIEHNGDFFSELRTAARRPCSQLKLSSGAGLDSSNPLTEELTAYRALRELGQVFANSAKIELLDGDPVSAGADVEVVLALADAAASQPLLTGLLVKGVLIDIAAEVVFAGLAENRWTDAQLARLESRLSQVNIVADCRRCIRGERAFAIALVGVLRNINLFVTETHGDVGRPLEHRGGTFLAWPRAIAYRNQITIAEGYDALLQGRLDPAGPSVLLCPAPKDDPTLSGFRKPSLYNALFPQLLGASENALRRTASFQATISISRVACALERYYLSKGQYPESLSELVPGFISRIPVDPVNGAPLRYKSGDGKSYLLYSVGVDCTDDGGRRIPQNQRRKEIPSGDWVWENN
ncbi:MAG: hypothetical protein N3G20_05460, partial [Verrucomicrobiae bacterium]|nr:hypothetical protein [Verrucomicrobiae bacterium]